MLVFTLPNGVPIEVLAAVQWQYSGNDEDPTRASR